MTHGTGAYRVYLPAGYSFFGFDGNEDFRRALHNTVPMHRVWVSSFLIGRNEVTFADYLAFLDDVGDDEGQARVPHVDAMGGDAAFQLLRGEDGVWSLKWALQEGASVTVRAGDMLPLPARGEGVAIDWLRMPVLGVTVDDAKAYAAWLDRSGRVPRARLCTELEWERAARGADARIFPHADVLRADDANIDITYQKDPARMGPEAVGGRPLSRSPWGIDDLTGNVFEWVTSSLKEGSYVVRGGAYGFVEVTSRAVHREELDPSFRAPQLGVRLCASWSP